MKNGRKKNKAYGGALPRRHVNLNRSELESILTFAKGLARASGALALSYYGRANPTLRFDHQLVTEADLVVQDYIQEEISRAYPDHLFLGEESLQKEPPRAEAPVWVVDPVDGTASFSAGMPVWGVSICLLDGERPVVGVFYQPVTGELYSARAGGRAMLNDRPITVREQEVDDEALLLTYSRFHSDYLCSFPGKVRSLGSSAAHLAYLSRGAAAAVLLGNVHLWDIAAGAVILEAAGGELRDENGKLFQPAEFLDGRKIDRLFLAAPPGLHREIFGLLEHRA